MGTRDSEEVQRRITSGREGRTRKFTARYGQDAVDPEAERAELASSSNIDLDEKLSSVEESSTEDSFVADDDEEVLLKEVVEKILQKSQKRKHSITKQRTAKRGRTPQKPRQAGKGTSPVTSRAVTPSRSTLPQRRRKRRQVSGQQQEQQQQQKKRRSSQPSPGKPRKKFTFSSLRRESKDK